MDLTFAAPVLYMVSGCPTGHEELLRNLLLLVAVLAGGGGGHEVGSYGQGAAGGVGEAYVSWAAQ